MSTSVLDQYLGRTVLISFDPGYVVLSYVVSLLGAGSTLELINRRTSLKGWYNHLLLVGAAISMGGIAIWSMHFIGNRAITLANGEPELQISYSIGVTVASFFVPIFVLLLAFVAVGTQDECQWWRVGSAGSLSGGAICGMHYLGDRAISNYQCSYVIGNVVGAALIAVSASTVALSLFFIFKAAWTNSWRRRAGCTVVLAGAVSGMHWCASLGTRYTLIQIPTTGAADNSRNTTAIAVLCLSLAASFIMIATAVISARTMKGYAAKAQQIVLAVAIFDGHGRILVSPEGLLPSEKITESFPQRSHEDVFSAAHPLFHWMYRASRNWSGIAALLGWMNTHLDYASLDRPGGRSGIKLVEDNGQLIENYDIVFRELFCVAAASLATRLTENILNMGVLWDEIFATGIETRPNTRLSGTLDGMLGRRNNHGNDQDDLLEKGLGHRYAEYGRGSLMFLVRRVESIPDIERLEAAGFRFARTNQVSDIIRSTMQIKTRRLEEKLRDMASHSERLQTPDPGVHVGLFAVRARMDKYGFDVLVSKGNRGVLPSVRMPFYQLEGWQKKFLKDIDGLPIPVLLTRLAFTGLTSEWNKQELQFAEQLRHAISTLQKDLDDSVLDGATLSSKVLDMPCRPLDDSHSHTCQLISLQIVLDINSTVRTRRCEFTPLQFFKIRQMSFENSPYHAAFARSLHREISAVLTSLPPLPSKSSLHSGSTLNLAAEDELGLTSAMSTPNSGRASPSLEELPLRRESRRHKGQKPSLFGGIMVSQEVAIKVHETGLTSPGSPIPSRTKSAGRTITVLSKANRSQGSSINEKIISSPRGPMRSPSQAGSIEMGRVNTPTAMMYIGGVASSNAEAIDEAETSTFVDELVATCFEKRI